MPKVKNDLVQALADPSKEAREYGALRVFRPLGPPRDDGARYVQNGLLMLGTFIAAENGHLMMGTITVVVADEDVDCYLRPIRYPTTERLIGEGWELA